MALKSQRKSEKKTCEFLPGQAHEIENDIIVVSEKNVALKILFFLQIKSKQRTDFLTEQQNDISSLDLL